MGVGSVDMSMMGGRSVLQGLFSLFLGLLRTRCSRVEYDDARWNSDSPPVVTIALPPRMLIMLARFRLRDWELKVGLRGGLRDDHQHSVH